MRTFDHAGEATQVPLHVDAARNAQPHVGHALLEADDLRLERGAAANLALAGAHDHADVVGDGAREQVRTPRRISLSPSGREARDRALDRIAHGASVARRSGGRDARAMRTVCRTAAASTVQKGSWCEVGMGDRYATAAAVASGPLDSIL